jgi:hypothetical protein
LDFSTQSSASIWVELAERIDCLIKDYITRDIDSTFCNIEILKPLIQGVVPQKNTLLGAELELMRVEWSQIWPASAAKSTKLLQFVVSFGPNSSPTCADSRSEVDKGVFTALQLNIPIFAEKGG